MAKQKENVVWLLTRMYYRSNLQEFSRMETIPFSCKSAMMRYLKQGIEINKAFKVEWSKGYGNKVDTQLDYRTISTDGLEFPMRFFWSVSPIYNNNRLP